MNRREDRFRKYHSKRGHHRVAPGPQGFNSLPAPSGPIADQNDLVNTWLARTHGNQSLSPTLGAPQTSSAVRPGRQWRSLDLPHTEEESPDRAAGSTRMRRRSRDDSSFIVEQHHRDHDGRASSHSSVYSEHARHRKRDRKRHRERCLTEDRRIFLSSTQIPSSDTYRYEKRPRRKTRTDCYQTVNQRHIGQSADAWANYAQPKRTTHSKKTKNLRSSRGVMDRFESTAIYAKRLTLQHGDSGMFANGFEARSLPLQDLESNDMEFCKTLSPRRREAKPASRRKRQHHAVTELSRVSWPEGIVSEQNRVSLSPARYLDSRRAPPQPSSDMLPREPSIERARHVPARSTTEPKLSSHHRRGGKYLVQPPAYYSGLGRDATVVFGSKTEDTIETLPKPSHPLFPTSETPASVRVSLIDTRLFDGTSIPGKDRQINSMREQGHDERAPNPRYRDQGVMTTDFPDSRAFESNSNEMVSGIVARELYADNRNQISQLETGSTLDKIDSHHQPLTGNCETGDPLKFITSSAPDGRMTISTQAYMKIDSGPQSTNVREAEANVNQNIVPTRNNDRCESTQDQQPNGLPTSNDAQNDFHPEAQSLPEQLQGGSQKKPQDGLESQVDPVDVQALFVEPQVGPNWVQEQDLLQRDGELQSLGNYQVYMQHLKGHSGNGEPSIADRLPSGLNWRLSDTKTSQFPYPQSPTWYRPRRAHMTRADNTFSIVSKPIKGRDSLHQPSPVQPSSARRHESMLEYIQRKEEEILGSFEKDQNLEDADMNYLLDGKKNLIYSRGVIKGISDEGAMENAAGYEEYEEMRAPGNGEGNVPYAVPGELHEATALDVEGVDEAFLHDFWRPPERR